MSRRKDSEKEEITAEGALAPQLGSDTARMVKGRFDIRKHTNYPNELIVVAKAFFTGLGPLEGKEYIDEFFNELEYGFSSVSGWNVNKEIQMVAASKGAPSVGDLQKKPGWVGRNITDRAWKKKADEEGKNIVE